MLRRIFSTRHRKPANKGAARVLIVADRPNWAYDTIAKALVQFNDDPDLILDIEYNPLQKSLNFV